MSANTPARVGPIQIAWWESFPLSPAGTMLRDVTKPGEIGASWRVEGYRAGAFEAVSVHIASGSEAEYAAAYGALQGNAVEVVTNANVQGLCIVESVTLMEWMRLGAVSGAAFPGAQTMAKARWRLVAVG